MDARIIVPAQPLRIAAEMPALRQQEDLAGLRAAGATAGECGPRSDLRKISDLIFLFATSIRRAEYVVDHIKADYVIYNISAA